MIINNNHLFYIFEAYEPHEWHVYAIYNATEAPKTIEAIFSYISMCLVFFPIKPVYKSEWSIIK